MLPNTLRDGLEPLLDIFGRGGEAPTSAAAAQPTAAASCFSFASSTTATATKTTATTTTTAATATATDASSESARQPPGEGRHGVTDAGLGGLARRAADRPDGGAQYAA